MAALSPEDLASEFPFKAKRGGRKPGSKNKPKAKPAVEVYTNESGARLAKLRDSVSAACILLERAIAIRIGLNDSENRVMELTRLRAQLENEALAVLRAGLSA